MTRLNLHFIAVFIILLALILFSWQYGNETFVFFGFSENKEMEIRLEHPVSIGNIHVTAGKKVKKGEPLFEVTRSGLALEQSGLNFEVAQLQSQFKIWESNLTASIGRLKAQRTALVSGIQTRIDQLESEISINRTLIKDLGSITPVKDESGKSPNEIKIRGLKRELRLAVRPIDAEIAKLENELHAPENPLKIQINKLTEELGFVHQEEEQLSILAPNDGIIGSIFCKTGEQFSAYNTLITFYEENPTQVKGYVLESLILKVNLGDSVLVNSEIRSMDKCRGKVIGMGSRIVEIPERLRKNPSYITYGREILIQIPANNNFLQKEKVVLKLPPEKGTITMSL